MSYLWFYVTYFSIGHDFSDVMEQKHSLAIFVPHEPFGSRLAC